MIGKTKEDLKNMHVACNTPQNALAAISTRRFSDKDTEWRYKGMVYKNKVGNPIELIRRAVDKLATLLVETPMNIRRKASCDYFCPPAASWSHLCLVYLGLFIGLKSAYSDSSVIVTL